MVFQDSTNLNNVSKYIVDANGDTPYTTVQSAITAAGTAGVAAVVVVRPGTYTESLVMSTNQITVMGTDRTTTFIDGVIDPAATGTTTFQNLTLISATDIVSSALAGTGALTFINCEFVVGAGYIFDTDSWTARLRIYDCIDSSTNNGVINNSANASITIRNSQVGAGSTKSLTANGNVTIESSNIGCPSAFSGTGTTNIRMGCYLGNTLTASNTHTVDLDTAVLNTGSNIAITHNSLNTMTLSNVTIDSTATEVITGTGTLQEGSITFEANTTLAATLTITDSPVMQTAVHGWNGTALQSPGVTITSDGATITCSVERSGGGDLCLITSKGYYDWDTTPADTIALTAGTDTVPVENFVYWLESTRLLATNTTAFPDAEHVPLADVYCQSAASVQTDAPYKVHLWTDHLTNSFDQGHIGDINHWIRHQNASWKDGVVPTLTITPNGGAPDNVIFTSTVGEVTQLHDHVFPAFAGTPDVYTVNDFTTPFNKVTDLNALLTDSANVSMSGKYFSLVIWGVVSEGTGDCKLMVNLPGGSYNTVALLTADSSNYTDFTIPSEFRGTGFLIAQLQLRHQAAAGGTWTEVSTIDLRGSFPTNAAGGSTVSGTEFIDNTFRILDNADETKEIAFQASSITTGTTRTLTVQDATGTLALLNNDADFGVTTATAGTDRFIDITNTDNTNAASHAHLAIVTGGVNGGDPYLRWNMGGVDFSAGIDNTDDKWKLTSGISTSAGEDLIKVDTTAIDIGTAAIAKVIVLGNVTGATSVALNAGTGGIALASTGAGDITINSDDTLLLDADGVLELNSSAGAISIGNDANAFAINVGTGAAQRNITIGNTTGTTGIFLDTGSGNIDIETSQILMTKTSAGTPIFMKIENDSNAAGSDSYIEVKTTAASGGDPYFLTNTDAVGGWSMGSDTGDASAFKIDWGAPATPGANTSFNMNTSGEILMAKQPMFAASDSTEFNVTGDTTVYTILFANEIVDVGSDFNPATGVYTAPLTGKYAFNACVTVTNLVAGHDNLEVLLVLTGRTVTLAKLNPFPIYSSNSHLTVGGNISIPMTAGDTAHVTLMVEDDTKSVDIIGTNVATYFTGELIS